eukprot:CAMPEP_0172711036 /NCGR_PEP_ID=MMETSP1074-20121228/57771_1 /TAXON_ID=2916 /ORGANISM="Ceratium fusus, Strain PA161109" /LENGTH=57 /DNA_ID=CAMNT_0013534595 /DNA_START=108 /DNA_END=277 /DNA_ORIENTATION=+
MAELPPPSRLIASTAPCLMSTSASVVMSMPLLLWPTAIEPSIWSTSNLPSASQPTAV